MKGNHRKNSPRLALMALVLSSLSFGACAAEDISKITDKLKNGDYSVVKTELIPLAEAGNARAQFNLGVSYAYGHGVPQDINKSFEWTLKAAQNGDNHAMVNTASSYLEGRGTAKNVAEAINWYTKAAAAGDVNAEVALGRIYRDGLTGKVDFAKAYEYFNKAAASGNAEAKYNLSAFYHYGLGVAKNEGKSRELFADLTKNPTINFAAFAPAK